jgi:hypothetical protein
LTASRPATRPYRNAGNAPGGSLSALQEKASAAGARALPAGVARVKIRDKLET